MADRFLSKGVKNSGLHVPADANEARYLVSSKPDHKRSARNDSLERVMMRV